MIMLSIHCYPRARCRRIRVIKLVGINPPLISCFQQWWRKNPEPAKVTVDLTQAGQSFRVNVRFLRKLVEVLRDQFLGATTIKSKARELSFVDLQHAIRHWLIGWSKLTIGLPFVKTSINQSRKVRRPKF